MSNSIYPTLSVTIPIYNTLIDHVEDTISSVEIDPIITEAAGACKEILLKYYNKTNESYIIATILDPRLKIQYYKDNNWGDELVATNKNM
jgi:predicted DNA-binding protein with PD1-like motif